MLTKKRIEDDLKQAMRKRDEVGKRTLRMLLTNLKLAEVDRMEDLDEAALLSLVQKEVKTRKETIDEAARAGRDDLIASTQAEIDMLQAYLPEPLSEEEIEAIVSAAIREVGAEQPSDMGSVMKSIMPQVHGRADGKIVSEIVRRLLSES